MQIKWQDAASLVALAFIIGLLLSKKAPNAGGTGTVNEKEVFRTRIDTARSVVFVPLTPLNTKAPPNRIKTIVLHDTVYKETCLDTLLRADTSAIAPDTLSVCASQNIFSISIGLSPRRKEIAVPYIANDTFYSREDTVRVVNGEAHPWYQDALVIVLSVVAGIIFGKL